ncbi:MAG: adenosine deaminase [Acidobacteriota bacterium]|jgi:adenosine deaminase|nr:adenosine deaminase family protein [Acidobacteriaceae bacterium]
MATVLDFLKTLPKAELHVHLEGSFTPDVPDSELAAKWDCCDFASFLESFKWTVSFLKKPEDYGRAARQLISALRRQGVTYAEITLSAGVVRWKKLDLEEVYAAVNHEARRAPFPVYWIVDCIRQHGGGGAMPVARFAARHAADGVAAFGIGGDETSVAAEEFRGAVAAAGVPFVPHAGEISNAENIWEMVRLGARRIGHGIRAVEDPALCAYLKEHDIPLEISLTSNVRTGAVPSLPAHPLRRLFDAGVPVVLGTDDPAIFGTTLVDEYLLAAELGFSRAELTQLAENSLRYGFQRAK